METSIFNNSENNVAGLLEKIEALEHQLQEQKKINESLKTTTLLLNYSSDYLFLIDRQFKITSYNEAFYNLIQYNLGISIYPGYPMFELIPEIDKDYYLNLYNKVLGGETIVTLKEWTNQAHSHYYFEESFKPLIDEDGVIQGILSKSSDITRRILAQEKFKQDEKHFQSVIDSTNDLIFSLNKDLTIKSANSAYLRRIKVGYNVNIEFDKTSIFETLPVHLHGTYGKIYEKVLSGENYVNETFRRYKDNILPEAYLLEHFNPLFDENGEVYMITVFTSNITHQKYLEKINRQNEAKLKSIFDNTDELIFSINKSFCITATNTAFVEYLFKLTGENINLNDNIIDFLEINKLFKQAEILQHCFIKSISGTSFSEIHPFDLATGINFYEIKCNPILEGDVAGVNVFIRNITQRLLNEKILKENQQLLEMAQNLAKVGSWYYHVETEEIKWSDSFYEIYGLSKDVKPDYNYFLGHLGSDLESHIKNVMLEKGDPLREKALNFQFYLPTPGGKKYLECLIYPIYDDHNKLKELYGVFQDITTRKKAEIRLKDALEKEILLNKELAEREERLLNQGEQLKHSMQELLKVNDYISKKEQEISAIFNNSPDVILSLDSNLNITASNNAFKILSERRSGKADVSIFDFFGNNRKDFYQQIFRRVLKGEFVVETTTFVEQTITYFYEEYYSPIKNDYNEITGIAIFIKDVSERLNAEKEAKETESIFTAVIKSSPDLIFFIDKGFKIRAVNEAARTSFEELTLSQIVAGETEFLLMFSTDRRKFYVEIFHKVLKGERVNEKTSWLPIGRKKEVSYKEEYFHPVYNADCEIIGIACIIKDVTSQKKAVDELKRSEEILKIAQQIAKMGSWTYDVGSRAITWSDNMYKLYEVPPEFTLTAESYFQLLEPVARAENSEKIIESIRKKTSFTIEYEIETPSGKRKTIFGAAIPILDEKGEVAQFYGVAQDITERKTAENALIKLLEKEQSLNLKLSQREEELKESVSQLEKAHETIKVNEVQLTAIIENTTDIIVSLDKDLKIAIANLTYKSLVKKKFGLNVQKGFDILQTMEPDPKDEFIRISERVLNGESFLRERKESQSVFEEFYNPIRNEENEIIGLAMFIRDITEKSYTLEKLRKNEQLLNLTGNLTKVGGWEYDVKTSSYYLTDQMYLMRDAQLNKPEVNAIVNYSNPGNQILLKRSLENLIQYGIEYDQEFPVTTKKGRDIWVRSIGKAEMKDGEILRVYGAIQDITDMKRAELEMIQNKELLDLTGKVARVGGWEMEKPFQYLKWTEETFRIHEIEPRPFIILEEAYSFYPEEIKPIIKSAIQNAINYRKEFDLELPFISFSGKKIWIRIIIKVDEKNGETVRIFGAFMDVTDQKYANERLKTSEERFRALFEKSMIAMVLIENKEVMACNSQALKMLQVDAKEDLNDILPFLSEDLLYWEGEYQERVIDWSFRRKDGSQFYGEIRVSPIVLDGKKVLFSQLYDLTDRKMGEQKIKDSENFLNVIIDSIPIGLMILDQKGKILKINKAHKQNIGLIFPYNSKSDYNIFKDELIIKTGLIDHVLRVYSGETVLNEEIFVDFGTINVKSIKRKDKAWFLVTLFPIQENGNITAVVAVTTEITEEKLNKEKIKQNAIELVETNKKMAEVQLMALRSVMNPHFLFNSLNSIQYFIAKNERESALNYLSLFSKLIRSVLNSSISNVTTLSDEISLLRFYIDLETLRFENKFEVEFEVDEDLDVDNIEIPSLILQPYVENAILHGLYNKEDNDGILKISFKSREDKLICTIEDNGIGRQAAQKIRQSNKIYKSVGMLVTQERLELINKDNNLSVNITDLYADNNTPSGTRVEVIINI